MAKNISVVFMTFAIFFIVLKAEINWEIDINVTKEAMLPNLRVNSLLSRFENYIEEVSHYFNSFKDIVLENQIQLEEYEKKFDKDPIKESYQKINKDINDFKSTVLKNDFQDPIQKLKSLKEEVRKEIPKVKATLKVTDNNDKLYEESEVQCDIIYGIRLKFSFGSAEDICLQFFKGNSCDPTLIFENKPSFTNLEKNITNLNLNKTLNLTEETAQTENPADNWKKGKTEFLDFIKKTDEPCKIYVRSPNLIWVELGSSKIDYSTGFLI